MNDQTIDFATPPPAKGDWLKPVIASVRPVFREMLLTSFFVNLLALAVPVFTLQVYDRVVYHAGLSTLAGLTIGVVLLLAFDFVLRQTRARMMQVVALRIDVAVGERLFDKVLALPLRTLESRPTAFWQLLFRDVDLIRNTLSGTSALLVADLPFVLMFLAVVFLIASPVAWILLLVFIAFVALAWYSGRSMQGLGQSERSVQQARDVLLAEIIAGRNTVKALALDKAIRPLWEDRQASTVTQALQRGSVSDGYVNLGMSMSSLTSMSLTATGALFIIDHQLTMGGLVASNMLIGRLLGPINQLVGAWRGFTAFRQSVERLGDIFALDSERTEITLDMPRPQGTITLENISFRYEEMGGGKAPTAIDGLSLNIQAGGITAILGRNGSGKTTLLKLVLGVYRPEAGRVLLDGADIAQFTRHQLAAWIGYAPQECVLLNGTIRDNIAYAHPEATDPEILQAATLAGVHQYIVDLPDGYGTKVGEAGQRLSAGQRQRLSIARALLGNPPVLLLDEPSSSLDRLAEEDLRNTLAELAKSRTILMVTHSPVLLPACRAAVVVDRGKILAHGPAMEVLNWLTNQRPKEPSAVAAPGVASGVVP